VNRSVLATSASPPPATAEATPATAAELLARTRRLASQQLAPLATAIDRDGFYPDDCIRQLAAAGAMGAHLHSHGQPGDLGLGIRAIAEIAQVCGSTGFVAWCHAACGLYLEESGNPALQGARLEAHVRGLSLGGTGFSNPIKSYAGIEPLLLKATPVADGYLLNGSLPWVSHLRPDGYCGVIARVTPAAQQIRQADTPTPPQDLVVLLRAGAPGVELLSCPAFSGMEGTSTYAIRLRNHPIGADDLIAADAGPFLQRIRPAFVLLQCGMGLGVVQGAIDSMRAVESRLGHVNRFLDDRPDELQAELDSLNEKIQTLARAPRRDAPGPERLIGVLEARAACSELSLRAAQSALLHQGARGYLASSEVQRRVRESHFVAIVTPALKHLRKEIARLREQQADPGAGAPPSPSLL
jgi:hypothetical protein